MSNTQNIKIGTCSIFFGGKDLGYTQGGVEVTVTTDTHQVTVDQFGKSTVNDIIQGRNCMVKVPLAETTLENLVAIMPGASLVSSGETPATLSITVASLPAAGDKLTVNGVVFTFAVAGPNLAANQIPLGAAVADQAAKIASVLSAYEDPNVASFSYPVVAGVITMTANQQGSIGNGTLVSATVATAGAITISGPTAGGTDGNRFVSVQTGVGSSLLTIAQRLVLHPKELPATDRSQDFVIPKAATAGAIKFTYKLDTERLYDVTFNAYPDPATGILFDVGAA